MEIFYFVILMMSMVLFSLKYKHLLLMLMGLEFVIISLYLNLVVFLSLSGGVYFSLIFMMVSVCESVLGLSVLVSMIRVHGNDYFQVFNVLW